MPGQPDRLWFLLWWAYRPELLCLALLPGLRLRPM